jgi:hypothetical protein
MQSGNEIENRKLKQDRHLQFAKQYSFSTKHRLSSQPLEREETKKAGGWGWFVKEKISTLENCF